MVLLSLLTMSSAADLPVAHISIDASAQGTPINPLYMGCHSDSGFVHQVRGFSSQMIFGESFEAPQPNVSAGKSADAWSFGADATMQASVHTLSSTVAPAMHGASSRTVTVES
jgi:hypothetical protein